MMRHFKTILLTAILLSSAYSVFSAEVASGQARAAVQAWLREDSAPLHAHMGQTISSIETYRDSQNSPLYYVVNLNPSGFAIVAADDLIEPIVAFAADGRYDLSPDNPLGALVSRDLPERMKHARKQTGKLPDGPKKARNKWIRLQTPVAAATAATATNSGTGRTNNVSDVRVDSLVQSRWSQTTVGGIACYNYFTPKYTNGCPTNYPSGCVATMMAQLMRYYQYPTSGVGTAQFWITIDGTPKRRSLRGGDGSGGAYSWNDMTLVPSWSTPDTQRQAIGALTYDAGVSVKMQYAADGSGAFMADAKVQLTNTFKYRNAIIGHNSGYTDIGAGLNGMVNPNLDAGYPVLFGITDNTAGHAIVCDGYGYNLGTLYHHLNLGWGGTSDAWYALPVIDTTVGYTFTLVDECVYNVYTAGTGEIISGRITDGAGSPLTNATVTAVRSGGSTYTTNTNVRGIYAFPKIPANSTYTLSVSNSGYSFTNQTVTTGLSTDNLASSGNRWGIDFVSFPVVTFDAQGGSVSPASITVTNGATYGNLPIPARTGYAFSGWWTETNGAGSQVLSATIVTITEAQTLYAKWAAIVYTLTVNGGTGGGSYTNGQQVVIVASNAPAGMAFNQWIGDTGVLVSNTASTAFFMPATNIILTATYSENTYTLTVNGGSGSGDYYAGTELTIVANPPPEGLVFDQWSGDTGALSSNTASTTFFTPAANIAVTATYKSAAVELTATVSGGNGTITPASASVSPGNSTNFVITATNYYRIATLTTNGTSAGVAFNNLSTNYTYTWSNVQAAGTVTVSFVQQVTTNAPATVPYSWLAQYFVTNDYNAGALADQDGDGMQTWQEYIAGTIPNNATSCLKVAQAIRNTISWSPVTGRIYSVHWATNLQNSFQSLETNIVWPQAGYTDTLHGAESRSFYKVKVQLAP